MKLLKLVATGFRNCEPEITIDFLAKSKKTSEDKEYELQEVMEQLYTFNTIGIIGKNASGKSTILDLLFVAYNLLDEFKAPYEYIRDNEVDLTLYFSLNKDIYRYQAHLKRKNALSKTITLINEKIYKKPYYKSHVNTVLEDNDFSLLYDKKDFPDELSMLYYVLKDHIKTSCYFSCMEITSLQAAFSMFDEIDEKYFPLLLRIFDHNIKNLEKVDETLYRINYKNSIQTITDDEIIELLSKGTSKGLVLYLMAIYCLHQGSDLLVDEIENHFHKTLVYHLIDLFKDKNINRKDARLIFSTHYCEILDVFNRSDNIWITKCDEQISLTNMYEQYPLRSDILKSKKFYANEFDTAVDYNALMDLKKELLQDEEIDPL